MKIPKIFQPKPTLTEEEIKSGLRWMTLEGTATMGFFNITGSGILVAFALALGANNMHIGIMAAIPFVMQIVQIPAVWLVEKIRMRKLIVILSWFPSQLFWFPIAFIPFFLPVPGEAAIIMLLTLMALRGILSAITSAAYGGWQRDLVPQNILGRYYSRRQSYASAFGIVFSLGSALFIDRYLAANPGEGSILGYTWVILFAITFLGMSGVSFMLFIPEPLMPPLSGQQPSMIKQISAPLKDKNFKRLIIFLFLWSFAANLAVPFFSVHMLQVLGISVTWVIGLSVLSQVFSIIFLGVWGRFADRFSNKSVLSVGISLYLLVILAWIFTGKPGSYSFTFPLLVIIHIFTGIAGAAVSFTTGTISLKLSPKGQSTSYMAAASLAINLGCGIAPLIAGALATFFSTRQLNLIFNWTDLTRNLEFTAVNISGRVFLFAIAFILGLVTLAFLAMVKEEGESGRKVILESLLTPFREFTRPVSAIPVFSFLSNFPFKFIKHFPLPGLDVALGVTVYQIAETARVAALAAVTGQRVTKKLADDVGKNILRMGKSQGKIREHGAEVVQHTVRGAMHVIDEKPVKVESLIEQVLEGVITASGQAGIEAHETVKAAGQGIVLGAVETGINVTEALKVAMKTIRKTSSEIGISEEEAVSAAAKGALMAAETLGSEVVAEVIEAVPAEKIVNEPEEDQ
jgi:MFS family permease